VTCRGGIRLRGVAGRGAATAMIVVLATSRVCRYYERTHGAGAAGSAAHLHSDNFTFILVADGGHDDLCHMISLLLLLGWGVLTGCTIT